VPPTKGLGELKSAIDAAAGKGVTIALSPSFTMDGYNISHVSIDTAYTNITIVGNGATFDRQNRSRYSGRFFEVGARAVLVISDVTLRNGYVYRDSGKGGAVYVATGGTFTVTSTTFSGNIAMGGYHRAYGGAVYVAAGGTFMATNTTFSENRAFPDGASAAGGALYFGGGGTGLIKGCSFVGPISNYKNDIYNDGGNVTFACADGKVGPSVQMQGNEIAVIPPKALQCRPCPPCAPPSKGLGTSAFNFTVWVKFNSFNTTDYPSIVTSRGGGISLTGDGHAYATYGEYGTISFYINTKAGVGPNGWGTRQLFTPKITTGEWHLLTVTKGSRSLSIAVDDGAPNIATLNKSIATSNFIMRDTGPIELKGGTGEHALDGEVKGLCIQESSVGR
jgi:hypothetical protein